MPQEYLFNGHLRWTFLWANPNCWAAFLACLMVWVWCGQFVCLKRADWIPFKIAVVTLYVAEVVIWFLLVKTYSRGGLVAAIVAMVFFFGLQQSLSSKFKIKLWLVDLAPRIALVAVMCMAAGFASRMSPDYVAQDKSILNRVDQWKGALVMINDSPFQGWGYKLGGMAYQNWYQPLSHTTRPTGFVNSYLEVAVEQGSHVLFLAIVCACALLFIAARLRHIPWVAAAGASLLAWLMSNLSSSFWPWLGLWILPGIAVVCLIIAAFRIREKLPGIMAVSLVVGIVTLIAIVGAGHVLAKDFPFQAKPVAQGDAAIIARRGSCEKPQELRTELWADAAVMGRYWGKTMRTILEEDTTCGSFIVYAPWALRENRLEQPAGRFVYLGFQAELVVERTARRAVPTEDTAPVIILHPTVYPPANGQHSAIQTHGLAARATITVCLPEVDVSVYNLLWRRWAAANGTNLTFSPQGGIRIESDQNKEFWRKLLFNE